MNRLQSFLTKKENKHLIFKLIKMFNPATPETYISPYSKKEVQTIDKITVSCKYDWVCISGNGIDLGVKFPVSFCGIGWNLSDFENEL